mmetsp:Transcript_33568/g.45347  ORF Transcript_33568/g.45347 Transcript_33568/m.45347 type:complete len:143 (-) Transcript_33568:222-650(-)
MPNSIRPAWSLDELSLVYFSQLTSVFIDDRRDTLGCRLAENFGSFDVSPTLRHCKWAFPISVSETKIKRFSTMLKEKDNRLCPSHSCGSMEWSISIPVFRLCTGSMFQKERDDLPISTHACMAQRCHPLPVPVFVRKDAVCQ